eukprot:1413026-Prorocentrum_lima.AAC.1
MTSSLVGSEMCIRDRWWPAQWMHTGKTAPFALGAEISPCDFGNHLVNTCLLYTSDAADDM